MLNRAIAALDAWPRVGIDSVESVGSLDERLSSAARGMFARVTSSGQGDRPPATRPPPVADFDWDRDRVRELAQSWICGLEVEGRRGSMVAQVVECGTERALWLPYVEVGSVAAATAQALALGASTMLPPSEGPAGRRTVVTTPEGGEIAFWQPKR